MVKNTLGFGFLLALLSAALALPATGAERTLMTLASAPKAVELKVLDKAGPQPAASIVPAPAWRLLPGETLTAAERPRDRLIELYAGTPQSPSLLARVWLRYYRGAAGWTAYFRLEEVPLVALVNGRWQPLDPARGVVGLVLQGNALPNAEGFFPTLEFGLGGGTLAIVGWQAR